MYRLHTTLTSSALPHIPPPSRIRQYQAIPKRARFNLFHYSFILSYPILSCPSPQFDDEYVATHHTGKWRSAAEMREALITSTAIQRVQRLDQQLEDAVVQVIGYGECRFICAHSYGFPFLTLCMRRTDPSSPSLTHGFVPLPWRSAPLTPYLPPGCC